MRPRLCRVALILLIAAGAAAAFNAVHPKGIRWYVPRQAIYPAPSAQQEAAAIDRQGVWTALQQGTVILDARAADSYRQGHIPGSVNVPAATAAGNLRVVLDLALPSDPVIIYCSGQECEDSRVVFDLLKEMGFANVRLYFDGWRDWTAHGMPVER